MKKIVVSGSASLQKELQEIICDLRKDFDVLDFPKAIERKDFINVYPSVHKEFYRCLSETDVLLLANFDKNGVKGYIGPAGFAELSFALAQNLVFNKNIEIYILQMPNEDVQCYDEVSLWFSLGWIKLWNND